MQNAIEQPFRINLIIVMYLVIGAMLIMHFTEHRAGGE